MRPLYLVLLLSLVPGWAAAQDVRIDRVEIVGKGTYQVVTGEVTKDASMPTGEIAAPVTYTNLEATSTIPARVGTEFGVEYRIVGEPDGADVTIRLINAYPAPGLIDPADPKPILETEFERIKKIGAVNYLGYGFENDWELVPGTWVMQIWQGDRKLVDESFTVVK